MRRRMLTGWLSRGARFPLQSQAMKLGELASQLGAELRGDANLEVTGVKGLEEAGPTEVTFVANPRYASLARSTRGGGAG